MYGIVKHKGYHFKLVSERSAVCVLLPERDKHDPNELHPHVHHTPRKDYARNLTGKLSRRYEGHSLPQDDEHQRKEWQQRAIVHYARAAPRLVVVVEIVLSNALNATIVMGCVHARRLREWV